MEHRTADKSPGERKRPRKPFPATIMLAVLLVLLFALDSFNRSRCAFGFGGFQCSGLPAGWGGALFFATLGALALAAICAIWTIYAWCRWVLSGRK